MQESPPTGLQENYQNLMVEDWLRIPQINKFVVVYISNLKYWLLLLSYMSKAMGELDFLLH